jgi:phenylpropionate dioxygenase-like ring-hydroxylating dioxygenase large terminal subunit
VFINFWYPIVRAQDLGMTPQRVRVLAHNLVVFRDQHGQPAVLSDTCIHRGASLSGGRRMNDGSIRCPYHGWRFDGSGRCTRIPSVGSKTQPPPRARVDAYPTETRYGIVFAFLGDLPEGERPPIMAAPEWDDPAWRSSEVVTFDVNYYYERSIENGLDPAHNEYVHPTHGFSGEHEDEYKMTDLRPYKNDEWGRGFMSTFDAPPLRNVVMRAMKRERAKMEAGTGTCGPNQMWTYIHITPKFWLHQYVFEAPIDENKTKLFLLSFRNNIFIRSKTFEFVNKLLDKKVNERNVAIAKQDIVVMNPVFPRLTPRSRNKELMMPADRVILEYRDKLKEFEARGWRMDLKALRENMIEGDIAYAIPSPGRRESRSWVLDETPLHSPVGDKTLGN